MAVAITGEGVRQWEQRRGERERERERQDQYGQEINDGDHL